MFNLFRWFDKYHYVPPCPKCNSYKTGRYIYVPNATSGIEKIIAKNYAKGELSKTIFGFGEYNEPNAYCENCGVEWYARIERLPLTESRIIEESKRRGITKSKYTNMMNYKKIRKEKLKEEKKALKKQKKLEKKQRKQRFKK